MSGFLSQTLSKHKDRKRTKKPYHVIRGLRGLILWALLPVLMITVSTVSGHSQLVKSEPEDGQALKQAPEKVIAWFSEELDSGSSELYVLDAQGHQVDNGDGGVDLNDLDHLTMIVTLPPEMPESTYTVHWMAASAEDGDFVEGDFVFDVGLASSQPIPEAGTAPSLWPIAGLIVAVLAGAGVTAAVLVRRRSRQQWEKQLAAQRIHGQVNQT